MAVGKSKKTESRSMIECRTCKMWVDLESCKGLTEMSQKERSKLVFDCWKCMVDERVKIAEVNMKKEEEIKRLKAEVVFLKRECPMVVNEDNQSAISLAQNPKYHGRSKHIDIKFHYVRDLVRNKEIDLVYCPSNDMLADIFTKGLSAEKFSRLRSKLGVVSSEKHIQCEKEC
ncbi:hypothetical protein FHG87_024196 [Trinorchestia longiramus]|nr:hypothetical protein FHG87_024196 [Trinorchestia longiramus]